MKQGIRQIVGRLGALILVGATALIVAGCGSSDPTPLQEAEAEYRTLNVDSERIGKQAQKARNRFLAMNRQTLDLVNEQKEAILANDLSAYREIQSEINAAKSREGNLNKEMEALEDRAGRIERKLGTAGARIEAMKGCDLECRRARAQAVERQIQCWKEGLGVEVCQKRHPVPRNEILQDVLEGE